MSFIGKTLQKHAFFEKWICEPMAIFCQPRTQGLCWSFFLSHIFLTFCTAFFSLLCYLSRIFFNFLIPELHWKFSRLNNFPAALNMPFLSQRSCLWCHPWIRWLSQWSQIASCLQIPKQHPKSSAKFLTTLYQIHSTKFSGNKSNCQSAPYYSSYRWQKLLPSKNCSQSSLRDHNTQAKTTPPRSTWRRLTLCCCPLEDSHETHGRPHITPPWHSHQSALCDIHYFQ